MTEPSACRPGWVEALAGGLRERLAADPRPCRVVGVDGWSGSGKTSLAARVAPALGAPCVAVEDLVPGWHGLDESVDLLVRWVLEPLAAGRAAGWRRWDWGAGAWGEERTLDPAPVVVVEGCGAGSAPARPWLAALVWLEVAPAEREARLLARPDWDLYEPWVGVWADQERRLRAADDPAAHADVIVAAGGSADAGAPALSWR